MSQEKTINEQEKTINENVTLRGRAGVAVGRREFLRTLGAGATVAAAGAGTLAGGARADTETNDEKRKARYRETEHVKTYYRVNRYPQT